MNASALEPITHSRSTLAAVVIAHVAAGLLVVQLFEARRYIDPAPLMVDLLPAFEQKVDTAPQPLPRVPEPVREIRPEPVPLKPEPVQLKPEPVELKPEPVKPEPLKPEPLIPKLAEIKPEPVELEPEPVKPKPEPIVPNAPRPIERVVRPEPAAELAPPPQMAPPVAPPVTPPVTHPSVVTPVTPLPQPVMAAPEPVAITIPVPPAPVAVPQPVVPPVAEVQEVTMTAQTLTAVYLRNPKPSYPGMSRRLGEQGTVFLRVFITAIGNPTRIELKTSSGYPRLDQAAQDAVQRWKFVPAKRGDQAVDAWVVVPIKFSLKG